MTDFKDVVVAERQPSGHRIGISGMLCSATDCKILNVGELRVDATSKTENWVAICPLDRLAHQTIVCARLEAVDLLLIRDGDDVFA